MTGKAKKYLIWLLGTMAAMFVEILITVALTGGRETEAFTKADWNIMTGFLVVFILTVIVMLVLAGKLGTQIGRQRTEGIRIPPKEEKKEKGKSGTLLFWTAALVAFLTMLGGIFLRQELSVQMMDLCGWAWGISTLLGILSLLFNLVFGRRYKRYWENQQLAQFHHFVYSHREQAEKTAKEKLKLLKRLRCATAIYACFLVMLGLCMALCTGVYYSTSSMVFCFAAALLIVAALSRIRFSTRQQEMEDDKTCVRSTGYPQLYALAQRAADQVGCYGSIRVMLLANCNAGITKINETYYIQLGVVLLKVLSEEELYAVLLHEFAHVAKQNSAGVQEQAYYTWMQDGMTPHFASGITRWFFDLPDAVYQLQYMLYTYASSILTEIAADRAMLLCGSAEAAASALGKLKFYELYSWEKGTYDEVCEYEQEQPPTDLLRKETENFRNAIKVKTEKWKALIGVEIQPRSATHPILRTRLQTLGVEELNLLPAPEDTDYAAECDKALDYVDALIGQDLADDYDERRRVYYLEPKACVEAWEQAGRPLVSSEYVDVVRALRQLGQNTLAMELCQRAIEELPKAAGIYGYFMRGCYRLHSYDEAGIQDIYTALESNSNYWEEGIDAIGAYCCLTGNQKELDIYREKALILQQKYKDDYCRLEELTPKDALSPEALPEGMLEQILSYIASVEQGQIQRIYLVRKTISEELFSSVFVIQFASETGEGDRNEILHKVYQYLDTCSDWQFSLFDYENVKKMPIHKVENSCVYEKTDA